LRPFEVALWILGFAAVGYLGYVTLDRASYEEVQTRKLNDLSRASANAVPAVGATAAASRKPLTKGELIGRLEIPGAGVSAIVAAGTDELTLRRGIGHIDGTALPGEGGNVGLAGHRDTVFRGLRKLRPADRIFLVTSSGRFEYSVESLRTVAPEQNEVLEATSQPTLTLVTCFPFDYVGPAPLRYIIRAREIGRPGAPAPPEDTAARP
jgi:sortase A